MLLYAPLAPDPGDAIVFTLSLAKYCPVYNIFGIILYYSQFFFVNFRRRLYKGGVTFNKNVGLRTGVPGLDFTFNCLSSVGDYWILFLLTYFALLLSTIYGTE